MINKTDKELTIEIVKAFIISDQAQIAPLKSGGIKIVRSLNSRAIEDLIEAVYNSIHNLQE